MFTENIQDTTKVQLNYKDNTEIPFLICRTNSTQLTSVNQSNTKKQQTLLSFAVCRLMYVNVEHILCVVLKSIQLL